MSTLNLENIKHPDSASNNISVDSSGNTSVNGSVGLGGASTSSYLQGVVGGKTVTIGSASEASSTLVLKDDDGVFDLATTGGTFRVYDDGLERMRIDSAGRVTMPYQPLARAACSSTITSVAKIPLNAHNLSNGGLSIDNTNNRMIVPVDGYYVVGFSHLVELANSNVAIRHNGSDISNGRSQSVDGANNEMSTHTIVNLSANDYIEFWVVAGRIHNNASYNSMYCYLLG